MLRKKRGKASYIIALSTAADHKKDITAIQKLRRNGGRKRPHQFQRELEKQAARNNRHMMYHQKVAESQRNTIALQRKQEKVLVDTHANANATICHKNKLIEQISDLSHHHTTLADELLNENKRVQKEKQRYT
ncbi:LOW QUALITY PROTEIN: hypothetical protein ACHAWO_011305 [Cyclotella atomus]|uniref:Uncharacterized protein n=1 Tax=Cyclotella atomus TaxID=382360 RepID=A0ABD3N5E4_9STRA